MSASVAFDGFGVTLTVAATALSEILSGTLPDISKDTPDVSHSTSPGHAREFIAGFIDYGEVTFDINYVQADYSALLTAMKLDTAAACSMTMDDPAFTSTDPTWTFNAHITGLSGAVPTDDKVTCSITLKITGEVTFAEGT